MNNNIESKKIAFVCGSTGGHVYPAIALAQGLKNTPVCFFTSQHRQDNTILSQYKFQTHPLPSTRKNPLIFLWAIMKARKTLKRERVTTLVATGGYFTTPVIMAARSLSISIYLCEQNVVPGKVTQIFF